ncbi:hypothetical protein Pcinc_003023 [Petrolisthes cinctipes]|uniref:SEC7 domain-containing protein n=1 Tax=Petrolisthes cinctipes TaxID=88211 RepID=A0AAE1L2E2_PETCI|nr:hypothetical protein Pcinc_003023 [Petrolisthes cinctipes]
MEELLDKIAVGRYFSKNKPLNTETLSAYVHQMDFSGLELVPALRLLLESFVQMSNEGSWEGTRYSLLLDILGSRYIECNSDHPFIRDSDTASTLASLAFFIHTATFNKAA